MVVFIIITVAALIAGAVLWNKYKSKAVADELLLQQKYTGPKAKVEADAKKFEDYFLK